MFTGKAEIGMGVETGLAQIVAEELDVPVGRVVLVMGDTSATTDQGGVGGSTSIMMGAKPLRNAAATARSLLLRMAANNLGVSPDQLQVRDGIISVASGASRRISYAELAANGKLNEALKVSGDGFSLDVQGRASQRIPRPTRLSVSPSRASILLPRFSESGNTSPTCASPECSTAGSCVPPELAPNSSAWTTPPPGRSQVTLKTVTKGNFVGVVAENEWAAIRAAKAVRVNWSAPEQAFPEQKDLYRHMRSVTPKASKETLKKGDAAGALAAASKKVQATYEVPFQSHATMGPGCAVADIHTDGVSTIWSGGQKPHALQKGFAELLGVPREKVRVIWLEDAGSYGRPGIEDTAADALLLSQAVGKPVRVQWSRADMTQWGSKGPAVTCEIAAAIDERGEVTAVEFTSRAFSGGEIHFVPADAGNFLGAQLSGVRNTGGVDEFAQWGVAAPAYAFANLHAVSHVVPAFYDSISPLRTTHLRDPEGPQTSFAIESFMDEIAAAIGADPIDFRLAHLENARAKAVLTAAAEKAGWDKRPSPKRDKTSGDLLTGRGVGLSTRGGTFVGTIAEVQVNRRTGAVLVTRFVCAHDCGLIINPEALRGTIAANLIQSMSRAMKEEVAFDRSNVTSVDWKTYPIARSPDIPAQVDIVLINHPEIPPNGAGEPSSRATAAAIANAIFDATGARVRQSPLYAGARQVRARIAANGLVCAGNSVCGRQCEWIDAVDVLRSNRLL